MKTIRNLLQKLQTKVMETYIRVETVVTSDSGDLTTSQLGAWVVGVVIAAAIITVVKVAFPDIFTNMINSLQAKLKALW